MLDMKTLEDRWYVTMKTYKFAIFEILRDFLIWHIYIYCMYIIFLHIESTDSMIHVAIAVAGISTIINEPSVRLVCGSHMLDLQPDLNFTSYNVHSCVWHGKLSIVPRHIYPSLPTREYSSPTRLVDGYIRMEVYWRVRSEKNHYASAVACALY